MSEISVRNVRQDEYEEWDRFIMASPQASIFATSKYFTLIDVRLDLFWVMQGNGSIKAGVLLPISADGKKIELNEFIIYSGIFFRGEENRVKSKKRHDSFQISEFIIKFILKRYSSINLSLCPQYSDMRPFLWHGYGDARTKTFKLDLRYTSYVNISELVSDTKAEDELIIFKELEPVRRYGIREARKKKAIVSFGSDGKTLLGFYGALMKRQKIDVSNYHLLNMVKIIDGLCASKQGVVASVANADGKILYLVMYAWDDKRAYYLYGAGNPEISESWQGSYIHWEVFKYLARVMKIKEVDLEGVNSPKRGWFKLGFGGSLSPYYQVNCS